jgi:hypothetical protein
MINKSRRQKIRNFLCSTAFLTIGLPLIALIIYLFVGGFLGQKIFGGNPPVLYMYVIFAIGTGLILTGSIFTVIRREILRPGLRSITGVWAIILGLFSSIIWGIFEIVILYQIYVSLSHR